jgi:DNA (cytosine-5)-methyltransferase 1
MIRKMLKTGPWNLTDLETIPKNGKKVFSIFHCGGGSTMGYKLAGFDVLGGVEIDPKMMAIYRANHKPKYSFLMGVQEFNKISREKLHELHDLDILDGSPPCSSFSMIGSREKAWGDNKKFREGQAHQVLDDLFFHFIDTAKLLQPKIVVAENVKGLLMGKAKGYVKQIASGFDDAGYDLQLFLLNSAFMGVPQRRERCFFIAKKKTLNLPKLQLEFNEPSISIEQAMLGESAIGKIKNQETKYFDYWHKCKRGDSFASVHETGSYFSKIKLNPKAPANTITGHSKSDLFHWDVCAGLNQKFFQRVQTFPEDYNSLNQELGYVCGMSVPPFMMQRVASQIYKQWLNADRQNERSLSASV